MGNYCCEAENEWDADRRTHSAKISSKGHSSEQSTLQRSYERKISYLLNDLLQREGKGERVSKFRFLATLGEGGQGEVHRVEVRGKGRVGTSFARGFALKRISKLKMKESKEWESLMMEKQVLRGFSSPFVLSAVCGFQDADNIFYLLELAECGDLFKLIFSPQAPLRTIPSLLHKEQIIKFVFAGTILGLDELHRSNIVHCDLKPENILLCADGYPLLSDFGVAKRITPPCRLQQRGGTWLYLCPEMLTRQGYDRGCDLWALGVLLYEFYFHGPPFQAQEVQFSDFPKLVQEFHHNFDNGMPNDLISIEACDLIKKLMEVDCRNRIGYTGISEIKSHCFFQGFEWDKYARKQLVSPLKQLAICCNQQIPNRPYPLSICQKPCEQTYHLTNFDFIREGSLFCELARCTQTNDSSASSAQPSLCEQ